MPIRFDKRNKRWRFEFDRQRSGGPRQRASRLLPRGWSRAQADKYDQVETARLYELAAGVTQPVGRLIDEAVLVYLQERGPALKNIKHLRGELARCLHAYTGRPIGELPAVAREYATAQAGVLAPGTIRNRLAYLRAACRYAWRHHDYCEHDPAAKIIMPRVSNERKVYLRRADMLAICRRVRLRQARAAVRIAFYSGMRQAEITRARVVGGMFELDDTKNGTQRHVPIMPQLAGILRNPALWPITITTWTISKQFRRAADAVGLHQAVFHSLRHSTASEMINAGVPLNTVGEVLGHKSAVSTRRYSHLQTASLRLALGTVGKRRAK